MSDEQEPMTDAELSRLLFEAREQLEMWGAVISYRMGERNAHVDRIREGIDRYRSERGWSPDGFGGE